MIFRLTAVSTRIARLPDRGASLYINQPGEPSGVHPSQELPHAAVYGRRCDARRLKHVSVFLVVVARARGSRV